MDHVPFSAIPTGGRCLAARLSRAKKGAIVLAKITALLFLLILLFGWLALQHSTVGAQDSSGGTLEVQVIAHPHSDGRVEFGLRYNEENILPDGRFLTSELIASRTGVWLRSTPVIILGPVETAPALVGASDSHLFRDIANAWDVPGFGRAEETLHVAVWVHSDGRIEFAVDHQGDRLLPDARILTPTLRTERADEWLVSTPVMIPASKTPASLVRDASYSWQDRTSGDIAEACYLAEVGLTTEPRYDRVPPSTHPEVNDIIAHTETVLTTDEKIWLFAARPQHSWTPGLQDRYVYFVRDARFRLPTRVWFAEFLCMEPDGGNGAGQDLGTDTSGGNSLE